MPIHKKRSLIFEILEACSCARSFQSNWLKLFCKTDIPIYKLNRPIRQFSKMAIKLQK